MRTDGKVHAPILFLRRIPYRCISAQYLIRSMIFTFVPNSWYTIARQQIQRSSTLLQYSNYKIYVTFLALDTVKNILIFNFDEIWKVLRYGQFNFHFYIFSGYICMRNKKMFMKSTTLTKKKSRFDLPIYRHQMKQT